MKPKFYTAFLLMFFLSCGEQQEHKSKASISRKEGWSEQILLLEKNTCTVSSLYNHPGISLARVKGVCSCLIDAISYKYTHAEAVSFADTVVDEEVRNGTVENCEIKNGGTFP